MSTDNYRPVFTQGHTNCQIIRYGNLVQFFLLHSSSRPSRSRILPVLPDYFRCQYGVDNRDIAHQPRRIVATAIRAGLGSDATYAASGKRALMPMDI
ncbi:MAG: hypothetical protein U1C33_08885 [Candidatus Cloacimonadaceae bacterium]|nr:hypothetical protein [Candidatus Cloacimonadaceae bacterium]